jgi:hypothetical protein
MGAMSKVIMITPGDANRVKVMCMGWRGLA